MIYYSATYYDKYHIFDLKFYKIFKYKLTTIQISTIEIVR